MPPIENQTQNIATADSTINNDFPSPLMYFTGMKRLIGEAIEEGIYVDNSLRDRGIEERPGVEPWKQGLEDVIKIQKEADNIGVSVKQLKSLMMELPVGQSGGLSIDATHKRPSIDHRLDAHVYFPNVRPFEQ